MKQKKTERIRKINNETPTCGIRHFRLSILIIYKLIIKVVSLSSDGEAETAYTATVGGNARKKKLTIKIK